LKVLSHKDRMNSKQGHRRSKGVFGSIGIPFHVGDKDKERDREKREKPPQSPPTQSPRGDREKEKQQQQHSVLQQQTEKEANGRPISQTSPIVTSNGMSLPSPSCQNQTSTVLIGSITNAPTFPPPSNPALNSSDLAGVASPMNLSPPHSHGIQPQSTPMPTSTSNPSLQSPRATKMIAKEELANLFPFLDPTLVEASKKLHVHVYQGDLQEVQ
jgi:hypothetical protein